MLKIIGREQEKKQLKRIFDSKTAEFVAVYGRRRVGKTYLIREFFNGESCLFFRATGIHKGSLKKQLERFKIEIETTFYSGRKGSQLLPFTNWHDAFQALTDAIELVAGKQKVIIFLDEIPWMATPKSGLLEALDYYWNRYWSEDGRIKLIICGSAASWIIEKVLHNTGGLHNRVTLRLSIAPFQLCETKDYLKFKNIKFNNEQILTLYMCLGGIPFYLNLVEKGLSAIQNINQICFNRKGALYDEFNLLFASLFKMHEVHEALIIFIASKREGVSRSDIEEKFGVKGGRLSIRLKELEEAKFIVSFKPWNKQRGIYYKVIDEYSLFYLTWIAPRAASKIASHIDDHYWEILSSQAAWKAWSGYSFELVCFKHIRQIQTKLHIPKGAEVSSWRYVPDKKGDEIGAQIDLIFDRPDNIVNLCEIKYCQSPFVIDKKYALHLMNRENIYRKVTNTNKQIFQSIIASGGLKTSIYNEELIDSVVVLEDLFLT